MYHLPTVGDFTKLVLAIDEIASTFDGDGELLFHSLDELLADTSVRTVLRLLDLIEGNLALEPQLYTFHLDRCSETSLNAIESRTDALVRIESQTDETLIRVS